MPIKSKYHGSSNDSSTALRPARKPSKTPSKPTESKPYYNMGNEECKRDNESGSGSDSDSDNCGHASASDAILPPGKERRYIGKCKKTVLVCVKPTDNRRLEEGGEDSDSDSDSDRHEYTYDHPAGAQENVSVLSPGDEVRTREPAQKGKGTQTVALVAFLRRPDDNGPQFMVDLYHARKNQVPRFSVMKPDSTPGREISNIWDSGDHLSAVDIYNGTLRIYNRHDGTFVGILGRVDSNLIEGVHVYVCLTCFMLDRINGQFQETYHFEYCSLKRRERDHLIGSDHYQSILSKAVPEGGQTWLRFAELLSGNLLTIFQPLALSSLEMYIAPPVSRSNRRNKSDCQRVAMAVMEAVEAYEEEAGNEDVQEDGEVEDADDEVEDADDEVEDADDEEHDEEHECERIAETVEACEKEAGNKDVQEDDDNADADDEEYSEKEQVDESDESDESEDGKTHQRLRVCSTDEDEPESDESRAKTRPRLRVCSTDEDESESDESKAKTRPRLRVCSTDEDEPESDESKEKTRPRLRVCSTDDDGSESDECKEKTRRMPQRRRALAGRPQQKRKRK